MPNQCKVFAWFWGKSAPVFVNKVLLELTPFINLIVYGWLYNTMAVEWQRPLYGLQASTIYYLAI